MYPMVPPKVMFITRIFHPNIHFKVSILSLHGIFSRGFTQILFIARADGGGLSRHSEDSLEPSLDTPVSLQSNHFPFGASWARQPAELWCRLVSELSVLCIKAAWTRNVHVITLFSHLFSPHNCFFILESFSAPLLWLPVIASLFVQMKFPCCWVD